MKRAAAWILPLLALGLLGAGTVWTLVLAHERGRRISHGSTFRSDGEGARALFLLLEEMGHKPSRLNLPIPPPGALLVTLEPIEVTRGRDDDLVQWVREGGVLVLVPGTEPSSLPVTFGFLQSSSAKKDGPWHWTRRPERSQVVRGPADKPVLVELPYGRGKVLALAEPTMLENKGLAVGGNLDLAILTIVGPGRPIYFDEYRHGLRERPGLAYVLARYGLLPAAFASLLFLGLVVWRTTPAEAEPPVPGPEPGEVRDSLVEARAGLYARSLRVRDAIGMLERDLRHGASTALGEGRALSWDDLTRKLKTRKPALVPKLRTLLAEVGRMKGNPPSQLDAVLPLSRRMADFMKEIR